MKNNLPTVLLLACVCTLAILPLALAPVPAQAASVGEKANALADKATLELKKQLLEARLHEFPRHDDEWTTSLLNKALQNDDDFKLFLHDDNYASDVLFDIFLLEGAIVSYSKNQDYISLIFIETFSSRFFPNVFNILPGLGS